jgi:predicted nucleic acid-binding Zn ribbon protein
MAKRDLALDLFRNYKTGFVKKARPRPERGQGPGDPTLVSNILEDLVKDREWDSGLAEGNLFATWSTIVGAEVAQHAEPISLIEGKLLVQCSSTAWATQLTLAQNDILATIRASAPGALVEAIRFIGPQAPSWKKGLRSVSNGRGPRDTYG